MTQFLAQAPDYINEADFLEAAKHRVLPPPIPWDGKSQQFITSPDDPFITPIEASDFTETSDYNETIDYLKRLVAHAPELLSLVTLPEKTDEGRDFHMVIASTTFDKSPQGLKASNKPIIFIQAALHPGEANGKDAGLMLLRDMVVKGTQKALLDKVNLLFVPVVNIDGDNRYGKYGRLNQNGPDKTGWRVNARNLNLNRDFAKLDSAEIRNIAYALSTYDPDFFADTHSTDGINYQYDVTYSNNGTGWSPSSNLWMDKVMTPKVFEQLEEYGHIPNVCISMNDNNDVTQGYFPYYSDLARFSNQYADIRGIAGILIEIHAIKPYKQQVLGNYVLFKALLEEVSANYQGLKQAIAEDRARLTSQEDVILTWKEADKPEMVPFKGIKSETVQSPITGSEVVLWTNIPEDTIIPMTALSVPDLLLKRPKHYIVPVQWHEVIQRITAHGIEFETLTSEKTFDVSIDRIEDIALGTPFEPDRESADKIPGYEGRLLITGTPLPIKRRVTYLPGSIIVPTNQRLGVLAMVLLESESPDSFLKWGFFNATLTSAEFLETYVMEPMARNMLAESPELKAAFDEKLQDPAFANSPNARLNWFYNQTPFADTNRFVCPIGKVR